MYTVRTPFLYAAIGKCTIMAVLSPIKKKGIKLV
jgi:uncharacterized OsmC-like protein